MSLGNDASPARHGARIAALVLAAGSSTRMGDNKMLLEIDGQSLLRRAALKAVDADFEPVVVITGHQPDAARRQVAGIACTTVHNDRHSAGIHTSVRAGIDALGDDVDAAAIVLADMPLVSTEMLKNLIARYRQGTAPLVISRYGGEIPAPPMLYDRLLFDELRVMKKRCGREVVRRHRSAAEILDWPREALVDIDTPADYDRVLATIEGAARSRL